MSIVFFCQSCGARFSVDASAVGKLARCKQCGQRTNVPKPAELASMAALEAVPEPAVAAAATDSGSAVPADGTRPKGSWIAMATSDVALAPLTIDRMPIGWQPPRSKRKPTPMDDVEGEDSKPYLLAASIPAAVPAARPKGRSPGPLERAWRGELGSLQKFLRWLNETAYVLSVPFLMMILLGALLRSRNLAVLGATVAVLLNVGRLGVGLANLVVIPFREGPVPGVLFLVPPLTFVYLYKNWKKVEKAVGRVAGPALTIGLVVLAFTFVPTLRRDPDATAAEGLAEKVRASAEDLKSEVRGKVEKARAAVPGIDARDALPRGGNASGAEPPK